jgi:hypothetical protein
MYLKKKQLIKPVNLQNPLTSKEQAANSFSLDGIKS